MEFTKDSMLPFLLSQLQTLQAREGRSFQFHVDSQDIQKANCERIWTSLRSHPSLEEIVEPDALDIVSQEGLVMTINGISDISKYCKTGSPYAVPHSWKQSVLVSKEVLPNELPFKVYAAIKEETSMVMDEVPKSWEDTPKYFLLNKKFVYKTGSTSIVLNHVRKSQDPFNNMYESDVTRAAVDYELYMNVDAPSKEEELLDALMLLTQIVDGTPLPLSKPQQQEVLDNYQRLVNKVMTGKSKAKYHFLAPKPVTLEKMNVVDPSAGYGVVTILSGYTVTAKADGERILMFINTNGEAYTINNTLDVRHTGMKVTSSKLHNTIIDGELVTFDQRKDDSRRDLFLAFDLYFLGGENVMALPLIHGEKPSRFSKMSAVFDKDLWVPLSKKDEPFMDLEIKQHVAAEGTRMFDACRDILENAQTYPYEIDGLVFTPTNLGVFAYYPGKPAKVSDNVRWDRVFKWKPAEQNTIDFLVEQEPEPYIDRITKKKYAVFKLFTGYTANQWEALSVMNGLRMRYDREYKREIAKTASVFKARLFQPITQYEKGVEYAYIPYDSVPFAENGDIVRDRSIVEFAYNPKANVPKASMRWKALRVREDKTRIFRTGTLSKTANDLSVAMSIWRTIHSPVTTEMIMGLQPVQNSDIPEDLEERLLGVDDTYYARSVPRAHMLSVHMLNFHNQGIKKMLYHMSDRRSSLLELACGMAGDLPRWRDAAYRFVLGVDLVRDNITHPREGSYARTVNQMNVIDTVVNGVEKKIYPPDVAFAIGDCALPLHDGSAAKDLDEESKKLLQLVYRKNAVPPQPYLKFVAGRAAHGFDVVSCQFAIHYFFQSPEKLHGFLANVSRNLKNGGTFIATFMDGDRVHNMLATSDTGIVEGRKLDNTVPVWAIIRKYTEYLKEGEEPFGKMVDVFLENTNRLIPEFLVNLDLLTTYASSHGLVLEQTALFSQTFADLRSKVPENPAERSELDQNLLVLDDDDVQKQFSFVNRWVVFRKQAK